MFKGLDCSRWQGEIDWPRVNVDFAFIKSSGGDAGLYTDGQFARNRDAVRNRNLPHGFYHFIGGIGAEAEADYFLLATQPEPGEILALDWEIQALNPVGYVAQMVNRITSQGHPAPLIYMNASTATQYNWQPLVDLGCGLWIAAYGRNDGSMGAPPATGAWPAYDIWQYTSVGTCPGIVGNVDLNISNNAFPGHIGATTDMDATQAARDLYQVLTGNIPSDDIIKQKAEYIQKTGNIQQVMHDIMSAARVMTWEQANIWALSTYQDARHNPNGEDGLTFGRNRFWGGADFQKVMTGDMDFYVKSSEQLDQLLEKDVPAAPALTPDQQAGLIVLDGLRAYLKGGDSQ